jgi:hypothetical protein
MAVDKMVVLFAETGDWPQQKDVCVRSEGNSKDWETTSPNLPLERKE